MINIEEEVFAIVATAVREQYPKIFMVGEYVKAPPSFPCVSLVEMDNHPDVPHRQPIAWRIMRL